MHADMASSSSTTSEMTPFFCPTLWGEFFVHYSPEPLQRSEEWMTERANQLKREINGMFEAYNTVLEKINLVDTLQHLGIDHLFEEQIVAALSSVQSAEFNSSSLHEVALRFRLLRQQGFWISPDEFNKFKGGDGNFSNGITNDPRGLLSLYNAAHLLTHGEVALEEAILFARHHLESMRSSLKSPLTKQVARALQIPLPRTLKRIETLRYISEYTEDNTHNPAILELAKMDFLILQSLHLKELKAITQWWMDLSRDVGLNYARDRVVECYFWSYTVYYEQEYTRARMILAKIFALLTLLDDTYDSHATLEDSRKLTEAIQRWDESAVYLLPEYLKKYYLKMMSNFTEFEDELEPNEKYRNVYNRKALQVLSRYYLQEAEWFHQSYMPSFEEQLNVSIMSSGSPMLAVGLLVGMGSDVATKEAFEWVIGCNDVVKACAEVGRFMDDMSAFKNGKNKNDVASSVECYINEHNVTSEVALAKIGSLVEEAWKTMNHARFEYRAMLPVVQRVTNLTMCTAFMYHDKRDAYTYNEGLKETIESLFVKSDISV